MKRFFYFCAALLCLSLAFHFGYTTARAQVPSGIVAATGADTGTGTILPLVVTANGDVYRSSTAGSTWSVVGNVFSGGATPALRESWGQLKSRYAPSGGTVSKPADTK